MKGLLILITILFCYTSCSNNHTFKNFYNSEKNNADFALSFPKYVAMIAIPKESKEEIKYFTNGMRKFRVLYNENADDRLISSFKDFAYSNSYIPYIIIKKDGTTVHLFTREEKDYVREIILDMQSEDETVIVAMLGKMKKSTFHDALRESKESD